MAWVVARSGTRRALIFLLGILSCVVRSSPPTRRTVILGAPFAPFAPALLSARPRAAWAADTPVEPLSVFITGANSGIGYQAARKLVAKGHSVTLACRTQARADAAAAAINAEAAAIGSASIGIARGVECDLASLASVRLCAAAVLESKAPIDVLVLNAAVAPGTQAKSPKRTAEGFEETIGVNHLGHFLLSSLLLPAVTPRAGRPPPRIVVTASEVHNPEEPGGQVGSKASLGDFAGLRAALSSGTGRFDMVDGGQYDPDKVCALPRDVTSPRHGRARRSRDPVARPCVVSVLQAALRPRALTLTALRSAHATARRH